MRDFRPRPKSDMASLAGGYFAHSVLPPRHAPRERSRVGQIRNPRRRVALNVAAVCAEPSPHLDRATGTQPRTLQALLFMARSLAKNELSDSEAPWGLPPALLAQLEWVGGPLPVTLTQAATSPPAPKQRAPPASEQAGRGGPDPEREDDDKDPNKKSKDYYANVGDVIRTLRDDIPCIFWKPFDCALGHCWGSSPDSACASFEKRIAWLAMTWCHFALLTPFNSPISPRPTHTDHIYRDDVVFRDPNISFRGLTNYKLVIWSLTTFGRLFFAGKEVSVVNIWQPEEGIIKCVGQFWGWSLLFCSFRCWLDGAVRDFRCCAQDWRVAPVHPLPPHPALHSPRMRWQVQARPRLWWLAEGVFDGISEYRLDHRGLVQEHLVTNVQLRDPPITNPLLYGLNLLMSPRLAPQPSRVPCPGERAVCFGCWLHVCRPLQRECEHRHAGCCVTALLPTFNL